MRDDMHEVIIERPRRGSRMGHFRRARRVDPKHVAKDDPESLPFGVGHKRSAKLGGSWKSLNENLAPLKRYLMRQVNRPWNKVWSDISANLKATSTVQQHVRDHVDDFVAVHTFVKDGVIHAKSRRGGPLPLNKTRYLLYVDPRTGILRPNKHFKALLAKARDDATAGKLHRETRMRELAPLLQVHRLDDKWWWELRLAPIPLERKSMTYPNGRSYGYDVALPFFDVVIGTPMTKLPARELYGRRDVYAVAKRQLSRAEIADLGLKA